MNRPLIIFAALGFMLNTHSSKGQSPQTATPTIQLEIDVFSYPHATAQNDAATQAFIEQKLHNLLQAFEQNGTDFDYLKRLGVKPVTEASPITDIAKENYLQHSSALELLSGQLFNDGKSDLIMSNIYIGKLKGAFPNPSLNVEVKMEPKEFGSFRDSHSLVTLYALAMDAKLQGRPRGVIVRYLAEALSIANDLKNSTFEGSSQDILLLHDTITDELHKLTSK